MGRLGDTLRDRRMALGLTVAQAEAATRIRGRLIKALEEGEYARLPNPGYVRGYISSYARFLELDSLALLNMYKAETGAGRFHDINNLPQAEEAVVHRHQQHAIPFKAAIVVVLVIALLSLSIWAVTRIWRGPEPTPPIPASVTASPPPGGTGGEATSPDETETAAVAAVPEPAAEVKPFTLTVRIKADGASWLKITVDGKKAYEGTLVGGQRKNYEVAEEAKVLVGRPSVVTVERDGVRVKIPTGGTTPTVTLKAEPSE